MGVQEEYQARLKRVDDALHLREPDRVPIMPQVQAYPIQMAGFTVKECMEDYHKAGQAYDLFYERYKPDMGRGPALIYPSRYMEECGIDFLRWPGNQISDPNVIYQFIEREYMKENEYPEAIRDLSHFMISKWIPRAFSKLGGFSKIDSRNMMWFGHLDFFKTLADPEVKESMQRATRAGEIIVEWEAFMKEYIQHMKTDFGIPVCEAGSAYVPFDMIGDSLRGTIDVMLDKIEHPDELMELIEIVTDFAIKDTIRTCSGKEVPYVWFWLHKGVDSFMNNQDFERFYWKPLKEYIIATIDAGLVPVIYAEGKFDSRLEFFADVPPGKVIYDFEYVDMEKAKNILGNTACIAGNVPPAMLAYGKKQEVVDYCKWLIDACAPGGGFIMDSASIIDNAKEENIDAMFETVYTYGAR